MKTVCLPLRVPTGKFCWEYGAPFVICGNFDNEGGHSTCDLNIGDPKDDLIGVLKPKECLLLKDV